MSLVFCVLYSVLCFDVFVVGCGSSTPSEDIVRFRCGRESYTLFAHISVKKFQFFCIVFMVLGFFCAFFYWFFIHICLVASLYIFRKCMIGQIV